jgi:predicted secreted protein
MSSAFLNGVTIKRGDGAGTEVFTAISEVLSMSGLGKTNPLVEVTSFDSTGREYIAGLADGTEITLECNYLPADTQQQGLISDVDAGTIRNFQVVITDGTTPLTYSFAVTPLSWVINPSFEDKNTLTFTLKISGAITVA